jgi:hypothetical protein
MLWLKKAGVRGDFFNEKPGQALHPLHVTNKAYSCSFCFCTPFALQTWAGYILNKCEKLKDMRLLLLCAGLVSILFGASCTALNKEAIGSDKKIEVLRCG